MTLLIRYVKVNGPFPVNDTGRTAPFPPWQTCVLPEIVATVGFGTVIVIILGIVMVILLQNGLDTLIKITVVVLETTNEKVYGLTAEVTVTKLPLIQSVMV